MDTSKLAFVDTETLGLDPVLNPIWEIAVIIDDTEHVWQRRLPRQLHDINVRADSDGPPRIVIPDRDRDVYVSEWVLENTGIRDRYDHRTALQPWQSAQRFAELVSGRHLVGAVPSFDEERLRGEHRAWCEAWGTRMPWHYHLIDVEALAIGNVSDRFEFDLPWDSADLSLTVGVDPDDFTPKHSALTDARWAKAMFEAVMNR